MHTYTSHWPGGRCRFLFSLFTIILGICVFMLDLTEVHAQAGVSISPARVDAALEPGAVEMYTVRVINRNPIEATYYLSPRNISGVRDGGTPIFTIEGGERTGFALSDWISLSTTSLTIGGGGESSFNYTLTVPDNASPGSHFGGVFISAEPPEIERTGAAVGFQVANIIHVRVAGDALDQASIRQFSTDKFFYGSLGATFTARIQNEGNALVTPVGPLEITNMLGQRVGTVVFNAESAQSVFPQDTRDFTIEWEGEGVGLGRYEALISLGYGREGAMKTMSNSVTFWVLPMNIIGPALGALAVLLLLTYAVARLYIRRTLAQYAVASSGSRRLVRRRQRDTSSPTLLIIVVMLVVTALFLIALLVLLA